MDEYERFLLTCPDLCRPYCVVCGSTAYIEHHHVVPRSHTRRMKDRGPVLTLCRGCHYAQHSIRPMKFEYREDGWYCDDFQCVTREVEPA